MINKIVIASNNNKKIRDLQYLMQPLGITTILQSELGIPEIEETGLSFVENAILKARNVAKYTNLPVIGDDSGLEVDALGKRPGIYSARYAGVETSYPEKMAKLLAELHDTPKSLRTARFQCVIVMLQSESDPTPVICHGTWHGEIALAPAGTNGFGYCPIFWLPEHKCTSAQLTDEIRYNISHRAQAVHSLINYLQTTNK